MTGAWNTRGPEEEDIRGNVGKFRRAEDHDPVLERVTRLLLLPAGLQLGQSLDRVLLVPFQVFPDSVNDSNETIATLIKRCT